MEKQFNDFQTAWKFLKKYGMSIPDDWKTNDGYWNRMLNEGNDLIGKRKDDTFFYNLMLAVMSELEKMAKAKGEKA